jgi:hypothetical protein
VSGAYLVNGFGKFKWLQKVCVAILRRYGTEYANDEIRYKTIAFEPECVITGIQEQVAHALSRHNTSRDGYILVGHSDAHRLFGECASNNVWGYSTSAMYQSGMQRTVLGLRVIVVPWMDGMLYVPESILEGV